MCRKGGKRRILPGTSNTLLWPRRTRLFYRCFEGQEAPGKKKRKIGGSKGCLLGRLSQSEDGSCTGGMRWLEVSRLDGELSGLLVSWIIWYS